MCGHSLHCSNHHLSDSVPERSQLNEYGGCKDSKRVNSLVFGNLLLPSAREQGGVSWLMTPGAHTVTKDPRPRLLLAYRGTRWMDRWFICSPSGAASVEMGLLYNSTSQETNRQILSARMCFMGPMSNMISVALTPGGFIIWVL